MLNYCVLLLFSIIGIVYAESDFPDLRDCKTEDYCDIEAIITNIINKSVAEPIYFAIVLDSIRVKTDQDFKLKFKDAKIYGSRNVDVYNVLGFNKLPNTKELKISAVVPKMKFSGTYSLSGILNSYPLEGHDVCNIDFDNVKFTVSVIPTTYESYGKTFIKFSSPIFNMNAAKTTFNFVNLYSKDIKIDSWDESNLHSNRLQPFDDLKKQIFKALGADLQEALNHGFAQVPIDEFISTQINN